jgi:hypothetical protein
MDWTLNCACHGKNKTDLENGGAKNMVHAAMLTESDTDQSKRIETAKAAADFLSENIRSHMSIYSLRNVKGF